MSLLRLGRGSTLRSFAQAAKRAGPFSQRLPRLQSVEVSVIVGSVGRCGGLAADFRPHRWARRAEDEQRLERVRAAMMRGEGLPPVDLYKVGSEYFVLDGHHRVAAARLLGQVDIDANVVELIPSRKCA